MFRGLVLAFCVLLYSAAGSLAGSEIVLSQNRNNPDLSGAWVQEKSKSGKSKQAEVTLVVSQREPEIRITRKIISDGRERVQELIYYSDQRGEVNPTFDGKNRIKTKTKWIGKALVVREELPPRSADGVAARTEVTEEWKLSSDGQTLTQKQVTAMTDETRNTLPDASDGVSVLGSSSVVVNMQGRELKRVYKRQVE